jgi:hypothetical protein
VDIAAFRVAHNGYGDMATAFLISSGVYGASSKSWKVKNHVGSNIARTTKRWRGARNDTRAGEHVIRRHVICMVN